MTSAPTSERLAEAPLTTDSVDAWLKGVEST